MFSDVDQDVLTERLFDVLRVISDSEYQQRVWIAGEGEDVSSYEDTICELFDDLCFDEYLADPENRSRPAYDALLNFREDLTSFLYRFNNLQSKDVVVHPKWQEIQKSARAIIKTWGGSGAGVSSSK